MWFTVPSRGDAAEYHHITSVISAVLFDLWPDFLPPTKDFLFAGCLSEDSGHLAKVR